MRLAFIFNNLKLLPVFCSITFLSFYYPLTHFSKHLQEDWNFYSSLSLVIRSSILYLNRLPWHDPWVGGGVDLLGNPQTRIFSPTLLLDLAFSPYLANWLLIFIYGVFGAMGMYQLLRTKKLSQLSSLFGATFFISSTYFGLHFSEGHVNFAGLQLLPWLHLCLIRFTPVKTFFTLGSLLSFLLLDGNCYPMILGLIFILVLSLCGEGNLFVVIKKNTLFAILASLSFVLIVSVKVVPFLYFQLHRSPPLYTFQIPLSSYFAVFFDPRRTNLDTLPAETDLRFHEFGCYFSLVALFFVTVHFIKNRSNLKNWKKHLLIMGFFFWTGTGLGDPFNPWTLFVHLPILNSAHIQSRLFIILYYLFSVLLAGVIDQYRKNFKFYLAILLLFTTEALTVKHYIFLLAMHRTADIPAMTILKSNRLDKTLSGTLYVDQRLKHYEQGNQGIRGALEPILPPTSAQGFGDGDYRGEFYLVKGSGTVVQESFIPGKIDFSFKLNQPSTIEINNNYLAGWDLVSGRGTVRKSENHLIQVDLPQGEGDITLEYRPVYFKWIILALMIGLTLWGTLFLFLWPVKQFQALSRL